MRCANTFYYDATTVASMGEFEWIFYVKNDFNRTDLERITCHQYFERIEKEYAVNGTSINTVKKEGDF
jgi:hypothetical protein